MKQKIMALFGILMLLIPAVYGAVSIAITTPVTDEELTIDSVYNLTGTIGDCKQKINCTLYDRRSNVATWVAVPMATTNMTGNSSENYWGQFEVPDEFGKHMLRVSCLNSSENTFNATDIEVKYARYDAGEAGEAIIDLVISIFVALVTFGSLIALVLIFRWVKKQGVGKL